MGVPLPILMSQGMREDRTMSEHLNKIMSRVAALLNKADDQAATEQEAATYRAKAHELMQKYRIAEEELIAGDPTSVLPEYRKFVICDIDSPFSSSYADLVYYVSVHAGIETATGYEAVAKVAHAVGYEADLRLAEMLYHTARLAFQEKLEPQIDRALSDEENVYRLRSAGIERQRVADMMWPTMGQGGPKKVSALYERACRARGEDPAVSGRKVSAKLYRKVYAREFVARFATRLRIARDATGATVGAMELHGRKERVKEAFYQRFPHLRPPKDVAIPDPKAKPAKPYVPTKADYARWSREFGSETARAASRAGHAAADSVDLDRNHNRTDAVEEDFTRKAYRELGIEGIH